MVAYLFFKNSSKMESKSEDGAGAILKANCLRFVGVFSYRYLRSDHSHTKFVSHVVCTLASEVLKLIFRYMMHLVVLKDNA
jgi:hypothetical protein